MWPSIWESRFLFGSLDWSLMRVSTGWMGAALKKSGLIMVMVSNSCKLKDEPRQILVWQIESSEQGSEEKSGVTVIPISPPKKETSLCATLMSWFGFCYKKQDDPVEDGEDNGSQDDQSRVINL